MCDGETRRQTKGMDRERKTIEGSGKEEVNREKKTSCRDDVSHLKGIQCPCRSQRERERERERERTFCVCEVLAFSE